jgi:hypothetical protein
MADKDETLMSVGPPGHGGYAQETTSDLTEPGADTP